MTAPNPHLDTAGNLLALIDRWVAHGWIRHLDRAVAHFLLAQIPGIDPLTLLTAVIASHQAGQGHVCLDLAACLDDPDLLLKLPPIESPHAVGPTLTPLTHKDRPSALLRNISLVEWLNALRSCPAVETIEGRGVESMADTSNDRPLLLSLINREARLYLRRYWQVEGRIALAIASRLSTRGQPTGDQPTVDQHKGEDPARAAEIRRRLDLLFADNQAGDGPDWQKIACAIAARSRFSVITGGPGTGKTTTVVRLLALIQSLSYERDEPAQRLALCAPTGKAAARLSESIRDKVHAIAGLDQAQLERPQNDFAPGHWQTVADRLPTEVTTLHRLIGMRPLAERPRHHPGNPLPADVVVVDEASMIGIELMDQLLAALASETTLILLGDKDQLASVEAGALLAELCRHADQGGYDQTTCTWIEQASGERVPAGLRADGKISALDQSIVMLRHSHRFGNESDIGRLAAAVNTGEADTAMNRLNATDGSVRQLQISEQDPSALRQVLVEGYRPWLEQIRTGTRLFDPYGDDPEQNRRILELFAAHGRFQLLCALRRGPAGVEGLNRLAAEWLVGAELLDVSAIDHRGTEGWYAGRPVLVTRNDPQLGLANGDIGLVLACRNRHGGRLLRVAFAGDPGKDVNTIRWINPARLAAVETAFALTVHKSQGSEFDHTLLILPQRPNPILTRELLYTAITRAKNRFTLVTSNAALSADTLKQGIERRVQRSGALATRIEMPETD